MRKHRRRGMAALAMIAQDAALLGFKIGIVVSVLAIAYIVYGFKSGVLQQLSMTSQVERNRLLGNMGFACTVLGATSVLLTLCAMVRYYAEESLGYILSILGLAIMYGTPLAFGAYVSAKTPDVQRAVGGILWNMRCWGVGIFIPGSALIVRDLFQRLMQGLHGARGSRKLVWGQEQRRELSFRQRLYGSCWDLPHCRDFVRRMCPAFEKHKSCWKMKAGCYCDERTILRALEMRGGGLDVAKNAQFSHGIAPKRAMSPAEKRERCRNCAIYSEHQRQKYRVVTPLIVPGIALMIWAMTPQLRLWLQEFIQWSDKFMRFASFTPKVQDLPSTWAQYAHNSTTVEWMFISWLSIMAISYALQIVEYLIFKVQV
jgi:hypothetical protein